MRLFVYGTLLGKSETPASRWFARRAVAVGNASVAGRLMAIPTRQGWYPALLPSANGRVSGMLFDLVLKGADRKILCRYEGEEYRMAPIDVAMSDGSVLRARAFRWAVPLPVGARPIGNGDFLGWLARTGRRPYSGATD